MAILKHSLLIALITGSAFAADSSLLNLITPDAKAVVGIHVGRSTASQFGQFLLRQMQKEDEDFSKFVTATGFDPRRDLTEVMMASVDGQQKGHGLVVARGTFNVPKLIAHAKTTGAALTSYKDVQVMTGKADGGWIAFLDSSTVAAGDPNMVRGSIDRRGGGPGIDAKLAAKVNEVSNKYDAWMVSMIPVANLTGKLPDERMNGAIRGDMIQGIEQASGGIVFGSTVQIAGEAVTRTEKDATALVDVVRFLTGMVQMNRDKPEMAKFAALLDKMSLKSIANTLSFSLSVPESDLELMLKPPAKASVRPVSVQK